MLSFCDVVAISNGAACTSASYIPSHVLRAMGLSEDEISWSVRTSRGPGIATMPVGEIVDAVRCLIV